MQINKDSAISLYLQIQERLEEKIISGEWEKGHRLPSEKELADIFDVSGITVKRAIQELVDKGLLHRQRGKGTFVLGYQEQDLSKLISFQNEAWSNENHPHYTLEFVKEPANQEIAKKLGLSKGDLVHKIVRLKVGDERPLALEVSFIPAELIPDLLQTDFENDLLYNVYMKKHYMELAKAKIGFAVAAANEKSAEILKLPVGEDLYVFQRYTYLKSGQVIEFSEYTMRKKDNNVFLEVNL